MIIRALEKHGEMTVEELASVTGRPRILVEMELRRLNEQGKVCIEDGKCYLTPKTTLPTMLFVAFLVFVCSFILVGAVKASL